MHTRSSLRLGSDKPDCLRLWLAPTATSLWFLTSGPLRLSLSELLESYHFNLKLSTKKYPISGYLFLSHGRQAPSVGDSIHIYYRNYSLLRWIFPEMVLGSSVRNSTILGYL